MKTPRPRTIFKKILKAALDTDANGIAIIYVNSSIVIPRSLFNGKLEITDDVYLENRNLHWYNIECIEILYK